ncbi:hypothetical protein JTE90_029473 [Oedothorax gibbosus]|uniref:Uncharacterized protein n=1 Tax=Oedothorax gibbosus TaxID=931172 RepID=A0AAV6V550_9ARAC|nr:hypothetical protein JTE90_029473 [Oedothorax gibbosus]
MWEFLLNFSKKNHSTPQLFSTKFTCGQKEPERPWETFDWNKTREEREKKDRSPHPFLHPPHDVIPIPKCSSTSHIFGPPKMGLLATFGRRKLESQP